MKNLLVFILTVFFACSLAVVIPCKERVFQGRIIGVYNGTVEVKKGSVEVKLALVEGTKIIQNGKEKERGSLEICQTVRAVYQTGTRGNEIISLKILRESDCKK